MPAPTPRDPDAPPPIVLDTPFGSAGVKCPCGRDAAWFTDPPLCGTEAHDAP